MSLSRRLATRALPLMFLALSPYGGCGGGGDDARPSLPGVEWLADGAGETNARPLEILRPGRRRAVGEAWGSHTTYRGRRFLRTDYGPLVREAPEGIFLEGPGPGVLYDNAVLLVPSTVRVGMKWSCRAFAKEEPLVFEVVARTIEATPFGALPQWAINSTRGGKLVGGLTYVEGYGSPPWTAVPLDPPAESTEAEPAPVQAVPVLDGDGKQAVLPSLPFSSVAVIDHGGGKPRTLEFDGFKDMVESDGKVRPHRIAGCARWDGTKLTVAEPAVLTDPDVYTGESCPHSIKVNVDATVEDTPWGSGPIVSVIDGKTRWARAWSKWLLFLNPSAPGGASFLAPKGAEGSTIADVTDWANYIGSAYLKLHPLTGLTTETGFSSDEVILAFEGPGASAGAPSFALVDLQRRVWPTTVRADQLVPNRAQGGLVGSFSVRNGPDGRVAYVSSAGRVDRLVVGVEGVRRERLANVELPQGHALIGAVEDGGKLLLFSRSTEPTLAQGTFSDSTYAWTAPLSTPTPEPLDAALGVTVEWIGADARVCWPKSSETLDASTWKIGGHPPALVLPGRDEPCALVVRDVDAHPPSGPDSSPGLEWNALEGRVPGVGRMAFATGKADPETLHFAERLELLAPVRGGGAVTTLRHYGPGGVKVGATQYGSDPASLQFYPDASGAGVWSSRVRLADRWTPQSELYAVLHRGATSTRVSLAVVSASAPTAPILQGTGEAGGVILTSSAGNWFVDPDGKVEPLPSTSRVSGIKVRRKNGQYCGGSAPYLFCVDAAGVELPHKTVDLVELEPKGWTALGDGTFLMLSGATAGRKVWRFDADTFEATPYPDATNPATSVNTPRHDSQGRLWGIVTFADGKTIAGRLDPAAFVPIATMPWAKVLGPLGPAFVPNELLPLDEMILVKSDYSPGRQLVARYFVK